MSAEEMKEQVAAARESADEAVGHLQQAEGEAEQALGNCSSRSPRARATTRPRTRSRASRRHARGSRKPCTLIQSAIDDAEGYAALL